MIEVLHINCNYTGNHVHRTMIQHLINENINNKVFVPVYKEECDIKNSDKVIVKKCFNKIDRLMFDYKSRKIRSNVEATYKIDDINIIHAYTLFTDGNVAWKLNKKYNIPYVVAVRNTDVNTFFKYMLHLRRRGIKIMNNASAVFFLSESYKTEVFDKYIPKKFKESINKKTYIIPNGIDDVWFSNSHKKEHKIDNNIINIIYTGRIDKNKNIESTQKALEILRRRKLNVNFSIVGKIEDKNLFNKIMQYPNTTYFKEMKKQDLIQLYRNNDIFIMPSKNETFGMVYAEAISQGLPVIYTRGQGFDKQFEEGVVGFSVDYINYEEIAQKIISIINNYNNISENCLRECKKFNWQKICKQYEEIYMNINKQREKS